MPSKNVMCDLETKGLPRNAVVLSIGLALFDRHGVKGTVYCKLDEAEQVALGRVTTPNTLKWWDQQTPEARAVLDPSVPSVSLTEALNAIDSLFASGVEHIWGNDTMFDVGKLESLYEDMGRIPPWAYWGPRCYRTLYGGLRKAFESKYGTLADEAPRVGTYHHALDDAITQVHRLLKAHEDLGLEFV